VATPAAPPTPPAPPAAPAAQSPPPGLVAARWLYVDEARTHEVHAGVRPGPAPAFIVKESGFQNADADEIVTQELPIETPWEAQLYQWQLECRLALMGRYWRHDATQPGWRALVPPQGIPELDLREVAGNPYRGRVVFHHFHHRTLHDDKLLVAIPSETPAGRRVLLALAAFDFPDGADADITLLHAHVPAAPAQSLVVREHLAMREKGFHKLVGPADFTLAHGPSWASAAGDAYAAVLQRISEGAFGRKARPQPVIDPIYTDYVKALTDPQLLAVQARYITPEEQEAALRGGSVAIRRLVAEKRARAPAHEQHKLTLVEASLLARDQLRPGQRARVDPEVAALVRRFAYYL
jgi:hypothetical protein